MIALLFYSTNCYANDNQHPFTGEQDSTIVAKDSVNIAYDDLRIVNSKLIELEYTKEINTNLRQVIANDSIIINDYIIINKELKKDIKYKTTQRNLGVGIGTIGILTTIIALLLK